ncbi:MAG TPA: B12-binding domain-containing protein [Acidimicrobiales bacterium]|jgi:methanogenic corrinoid protein MtbC1|nr:B12-binding domain-containing protein [Acidimicrobiales bacterium]
MSGSDLVTPEQRAAYWQALSDGDGPAAVHLALDLVDAGHGVVDILEDLVAPGQVELSAQWATNAWKIGRQHRAAGVSEEVVMALAARLEPTGDRGTAVVTSVDAGGFGVISRIVATALRAEGWWVHYLGYLGTAMPELHLSQLLEEVDPDVSVLSCSIPTGLRLARLLVEASRSVGVPVLAEGPGFGDDGRWGRLLGANGSAAGGRAALELLAGPKWPAGAEPVPPLGSPDDGSNRIQARRTEIIVSALDRLPSGWPTAPVRQRPPLVDVSELITYMVDYLTAALMVDDVSLYTDFISWASRVLTARGVDPIVIRGALSTTADTIWNLIGRSERTARFVGAAQRALGA